MAGPASRHLPCASRRGHRSGIKFLNLVLYLAEETEECFEKSLALNPNRGALHFYYAEFLQSIGAEDKARDHSMAAKNLGFTADKRLRRNCLARETLAHG